MKKTEMVAFVEENKKKVSKQLKTEIKEILKLYKKDEKSVPVAVFRELIKSMKEELSDATPQASAASLKKGEKKSKKAEKEEKEEKEEKPKKKAKKAKKYESGVEAENTKGEAFDLAEAFKDEFDTPLGTIKKDDSIKKIQDVADILEKGEKEVLCAVYWTKRHLEQFPYSAIKGVKQPKKFDNDLDLVSIIFVAPDNSLMVGISSYTFVPYVFVEESMESHDGIRYNCGAEFNVYTLEGEAK